MKVIRDTESRRVTTPNGVMTTLASAIQGGSGQAVWRVEMVPGAQGPVHAFDTDQVWTVLAGAARLALEDETVAVRQGDTVILPADVQRQVFADPTHGFTAIACAPATTRLHRIDPTAAVPSVASLDGDKILPDWIA
ncbi:MAG TPA: cupin domain-containing protein [Pseudonocardiaceae bacterium]|jgi:quercetin dioxygenase-like cupin family protein